MDVLVLEWVPDDAHSRVLDVQRLHRDVHVAVECSHASQHALANRSRHDLKSEVGDLAKLSTANLRISSVGSAKLEDKFVGPFRVKPIGSPVLY